MNFLRRRLGQPTNLAKNGRNVLLLAYSRSEQQDNLLELARSFQTLLERVQASRIHGGDAKDEGSRRPAATNFCSLTRDVFSRCFEQRGALVPKTNTQVMSGSRLHYRPFGGAKPPAV